MIVSCKTTKNDTAMSVNQEKLEELLLLKENSLVNYPDFSLINSNEELGRVFGILNSTRMPGINAPEVDFNHNSILLVNFNLEEKKYSDITLNQVRVSDNQLQIKYHGNNDNQDMLGIPNSYRVIKLIKVKKATSIIKIEEF